MSDKPSQSQRRSCIGCGAPYRFGRACVRCWPRLPWEVRLKIMRGSADVRDAGLIEMAHWFRDNPPARA